MPISVFNTPLWYRGLTRELFSRALEKIPGPDYSNLLYIAPTPWKIHDAQRVFHAVAGDCYIPPAMMTLEHFCKRQFSLYENRRIVSSAFTSVILSKLSNRNLGHSCLIADFLSEMEQYHPGKSMKEIATDVNAVFHRLGIPEEVSSRAVEAVKIAGTYKDILKRYNAVDVNDAMEICQRIIREQNVSYNYLIVDGFFELTPTETRILTALIENIDTTIISVFSNIDSPLLSNSITTILNNNFIFETFELSQENRPLVLSHYPYPGIEEEIESIARNIKYQFIAGTLPDLEKVFVVFPEIHKFLNMISRVFKKYGIPFTVTSQIPLARTRPILDLMALLESVSNDYPRLPFSQFLISPFFKALPSSFARYIPSLCISSSFTKGKSSWLDLLKSMQENIFSALTIGNVSKTIEHDLIWVFKKLSHLESIRQKGSFSDYSDAVIHLLNDLGFDDISDNDRNTRDTVNQILNELPLVDEFCGNTSSNLHDFTEALKHFLLNVKIPESETAGVRVMRFMDLWGLEPEHLYFGGLRDGEFPLKPDIDHVMPDSVRREIGLMNMEKYLRIQQLLFTRVLSSSESYSLSYPVMEGDKVFLPSSFLSWKDVLSAPVHGIFSKEEDLIRKNSTRRSSIISEVRRTNKRMIQNLFGEHSSIRVTDIDAYRACPRKFFIERVLFLKPLQIMKFEVEALTLGTIVHEIMQALLSDSFGDLDTLALNAGEKIDSLLSNKSLEEYWKRVLKNTFMAILPDLCDIERKIADDGYSFAEAEIPVKGEVLQSITLKGKIDRIDTKNEKADFSLNGEYHGISINPSPCTKVVELIDYKTGATQFSGPQVLSQGTNLQLLLYAALMRCRGMCVERVGIYSLKDLSVSWIPNKKDVKEGRTLDYYVEAAFHFLRETVLSMRNGNFTAHPLSEQTCRNCPEGPYCPYIQKAALG